MALTTPNDRRVRLQYPAGVLARRRTLAIQLKYVAWLDEEIAAGRDPEPGIWDLDEARDPGAAPRVGQGDEADVLPPGPLLVALTEEAVRDFGTLSDNELTGVLQAARRQQIREEYKQVLVIAEFGRRRLAAAEDAKRRGVPVKCT